MVGGSAVSGKRFGWWADKGFWAVMDQGLFAVSNFVLNVFLVRWMAPDAYGAFTVAYSIFLLTGTFHTSLFTEPMLVYGPGRYISRFASYLRLLVRDHWVATFGLGVLFAAAGLVAHAFGHSELTPALLGLGFASPLILFQWLMRRACYVRLQPRLAAFAGFVYMASVFGGAWAVYRLDLLSAASALVIMGLASAVSGSWLVIALTGRHPPKAEDDLSRDLIVQHWRYGRWSAATAALTWVPSNIYYVILPTTAGLAASAALRALYNVIMPILHLNSALGSIVLPGLVRARRRGGFHQILALAGSLMVGGAIVYWLVISLAGREVLAWLYGGKYTEFASVIVVLGALPAVAALNAVLSDALRAIERPDRVFWAYGASTVFAVSGGPLLLRAFGVYGAAIALVVSASITVSVLATFFLRDRRSSIEPENGLEEES